VLLIQAVAALLLLLGSALIFRALVALDMADRPRPAVRPRLVVRLDRERRHHDTDLPRAA
jgi:hypothetical protein